MAGMKSTDLLTAGKIAESLGVSVGKIKKAIDEQGIKPTSIARGCSYYDDACVAKIKSALK
jgi:hypothetical protein